MNTTKLHYNYFASSGGPRKLATDNSGVVVCIGQEECWPHYSDNNRDVVYRTTDFGKTWSSPQTFTKGVGGTEVIYYGMVVDSFNVCNVIRFRKLVCIFKC